MDKISSALWFQASHATVRSHVLQGDLRGTEAEMKMTEVAIRFKCSCLYVICDFKHDLISHKAVRK